MHLRQWILQGLGNPRPASGFGGLGFTGTAMCGVGTLGDDQTQKRLQAQTLYFPNCIQPGHWEPGRT